MVNWVHEPPSVPRVGEDVPADDAILVRRALGDPLAFGKLYEAHRDRVYGYLLARTGNPDDAADLTQQVFVKALDALPQYRPGKGPFVAWLFGIARNAATNFRQRGRAMVAWDFVASTPADTSPALGPEDSALRHEALEQLVRLCTTLAPVDQEMLALRFVAGLTSAEIGAVIGKSEAATKKQLTRTLRKLQEHYNDNPS